MAKKKNEDRRLSDIQTQLQKNLNSRLAGCRFREMDGADFDAETQSTGHDKKQITFVKRADDVIELYKGDVKIGSIGGNSGAQTRSRAVRSANTVGYDAIMYTNEPSGWDYRASDTYTTEQTTYGTTKVNEINTTYTADSEDQYTIIPFNAVRLIDDPDHQGYKKLDPYWINAVWSKRTDTAVPSIRRVPGSSPTISSVNKAVYDKIGYLTKEDNNVVYNEAKIFPGMMTTDVVPEYYSQGTWSRQTQNPYLFSNLQPYAISARFCIQIDRYILQNGFDPGPVTHIGTEFDFRSGSTRANYGERFSVRKCNWNSGGNSKFNTLSFSVSPTDPRSLLTDDDACADFSGSGLCMAFKKDDLVTSRSNLAQPTISTYSPSLCIVDQEYTLVLDDMDNNVWHVNLSSIYSRNVIATQNKNIIPINDDNLSYIYDIIYKGRRASES